MELQSTWAYDAFGKRSPELIDHKNVNIKHGIPKNK